MATWEHTAQGLRELEWLCTAERMAAHMPLPAEAIVDVWRRHPEWAPRARSSLPSSRLQAILLRVRRFLLD